MAPTLFLMVGLPGAGKTTYARALAAERPALLLTPDDWMIPLFAASDPDGRRAVLEGRLVSVALQVLALGADVVLDFGLWGRAERWSLRALATSVGARAEVVYLPVDHDEQRARVARRWTTAPEQTDPMTEAEMVSWRAVFEAPDPSELADGAVPDPPDPWTTWRAWAAERWPSL